MQFHRALPPREQYEINSVVRRAIDVCAENEAKVVIRFMDASTGEEIVSGDIVDFFREPERGVSFPQWISNISHSLNIHNEIAIYPTLLGTEKYSSLDQLKVLYPEYLQANPPQAMSLEFVNEWFYNNGLQVDGINPVITLPKDKLVFYKGYNPLPGVRGSSIGVSIVNEVSQNYYAANYNIQKFKNGVAGDIIVTFPPGTKVEVAQDWVDRYTDSKSISRNNAFGVSAAIGDIKVETIGLAAKEGEFLLQSNYNNQRIAGSYGVPAALIGFYELTRFDTMDAELESFAENKVLPDLCIIQEVIQTCVDRFFSTSKSRKAKTSLSPRLSKSLKDAQVKRRSGVIVLLDTDALPIFARLNKSKVDQAKALIDTFNLSSTEAANYSGIDIPGNKLRDDIYIPNNVTNISDPATNPLRTTPEGAQAILGLQVAYYAGTIPQAAVIAQAIHVYGFTPEEAAALFTPVAKEEQSTTNSDSELVVEPEAPEVPETPDAEVKSMDGVKGFYRNFRSRAIKALSRGEWLDKGAILEAAKVISPATVSQVHRDIVALGKMHRDKVDVAIIKEYFKVTCKSSRLRALV